MWALILWKHVQVLTKQLSFHPAYDWDWCGLSLGSHHVAGSASTVEFYFNMGSDISVS